MFTPEFSAAFRAAQERLDAKQAASPERARINDEVAQIMARVEAARELEAALPSDDDDVDDECDDETAKSKKRDVNEADVSAEKAYGEKLDNPLFTPQFKQAFIEAQDRLAKANAPMMAKINDEVADIMATVKAEREALARGEAVDTSQPLRARRLEGGETKANGTPNAETERFRDATRDSARDARGGDARGGDARGGDAFADDFVEDPGDLDRGAPKPSPRPDPDALLQMRAASEAQVGRLRATLRAAEQAVLAEQMQLQRIEFAIEKAAREVRYAEADRVARERRERRDHPPEER